MTRAPVRQYVKRDTPQGVRVEPIKEVDSSVNDPEPEVRENPRGELREPTAREKAEMRAAELRGNRDASFDGTDEFYIDKSVIPDGWVYEWKTWTVLGQEQQTRMMGYKRAGWEEVPRTRHPDMMPVGSKDPHIIRQGNILMELPDEIVREYRAQHDRTAREQVRIQEGKAKGGEGVHEGFDTTLAKNSIKHSYDAVRIPD